MMSQPSPNRVFVIPCWAKVDSSFLLFQNAPNKTPHDTVVLIKGMSTQQIQDHRKTQHIQTKNKWVIESSSSEQNCLSLMDLYRG